MSDTPTTVDDIKALVKRVEKENAKPADVEKLREVLREADKAGIGIDVHAKLTSSTYQAVVKSMSRTGMDEIGIERTCEKKKAALGYAEASPLEKMLIDAVVLAWLRYTHVERCAANTWGGSHSLPLGEYWDKRLSAAQRRYLRAIETLARVRRMGPAVLQVNIAQQQIVNQPG